MDSITRTQLEETAKRAERVAAIFVADTVERWECVPHRAGEVRHLDGSYPAGVRVKNLTPDAPWKGSSWCIATGAGVEKEALAIVGGLDILRHRWQPVTGPGRFRWWDDLRYRNGLLEEAAWQEAARPTSGTWYSEPERAVRASGVCEMQTPEGWVRLHLAMVGLPLLPEWCKVPVWHVAPPTSAR